MQREKGFTSESKKTELPEVKNLYFKREKNFTSESKETEFSEVKNLYFKREKNFTSGGKETELPEVKNFVPNYNNTNNNNQSDTDVSYSNTNYNNQSDTDMSYNNPIYPSENQQKDRIDGIDDVNAYIAIIKENIEYEHHMKYDQYEDKELYEELFGVICEVVCVKHKTVRIGGEEYPYELVKAKFLKLTATHLDYVMHCMKNTTTKIGNIKAYMVTALYNAPNTINHYYQQEVQHDMYGGGWHEKGIV